MRRSSGCSSCTGRYPQGPAHRRRTSGPARDLPELVRGIHAIDGIESIALTTQRSAPPGAAPPLPAGRGTHRRQPESGHPGPGPVCRDHPAGRFGPGSLRPSMPPLEAPACGSSSTASPWGERRAAGPLADLGPGARSGGCGASSSCPSAWAAPSPPDGREEVRAMLEAAFGPHDPCDESLGAGPDTTSPFPASGERSASSAP